MHFRRLSRVSTFLAALYFAGLFALVPHLRAAVTSLDTEHFRQGENDALVSDGAQSTAGCNRAGNSILMPVGTPHYSSDTSSLVSFPGGSTFSTSFSGSDGFRKTGVLNTHVNNFGVEAWVKPAGNTGARCIAYNGETGSSGWGIYQNGNVFQGFYGGLAFFGNGPVTPNTWTHVALVRNAGTATLYVNGVAYGTTAITPILPAGKFTVGVAPADQEYFIGKIDEVRCFTFATGAFEVKDLLLGSPRIVVEHPAGSPLAARTLASWGHNGWNQLDSGRTDLRAVAAGFDFSVGLKYDGTLVGWGLNHAGQLNLPPGLTEVKAIDAGGEGGLALKKDGTVVAWGDNSQGNNNVPTGLSGVKAISAGGHRMALKNDGTVVAWGRNFGGGTNVPANLTGVTAISAGSDHSVALKADGTVVAWGFNNSGQTNVPAGLTGVTAISAGSEHTVALKSDGTIVAWGGNVEGECNVPPGLNNVQAIFAANRYTEVLKTDGTMVAWGWSTSGQTAVPPGTAAVETLSAGGYHTLALVNSIVDFGSPPLGQVGTTKTFTIKNTGNVPLSFSHVTIVGAHASDFLLDTGGMQNPLPAGAGSTTIRVTFKPGGLGTRRAALRVASNDGETGDFQVALTGTGAPAPEIQLEQTAGVPLPMGVVSQWGAGPTIPAGLENVKSVAGGDLGFALALKKDGTIASWGLGGGGAAAVPAAAVNVTDIAAGYDHALALKNDFTVMAWGDNRWGQTTVPAGLTGVVQIAAGIRHSVARKLDGTVVVWGDNSEGQCNVPPGLNNVVKVVAGGYHTLALRANGTVVAWGSNHFGQCNVPANLPVAVSITAGALHSGALLNGSLTVVCWGENLYQQCDVPPGLNSVFGLSAHTNSTLAFTANTTLVGWGANEAGQLNVPAGLVDVKAFDAPGKFSLAVTNSAVAFGSQPVTTSATKTFTIKNLGSGLLTIGEVSVVGPHAADFSVSTDGMLTTVPGGGQTTVNVTFRPGSTGFKLAGLRVNNSDPDEGVYEVTLTGTGTASIDANLASLTLSQGVLATSFSSGATSYSAAVSAETATITVTPSVSHAGASVKVNGNPVASGTASGAISLSEGANAISIVVTAEDGVAAKTYTLTVHRVSTEPGATYFVSAGNANAVAPYADLNSAARDIQSVVEIASPGSVIFVNDGIYNTGSKIPAGGLLPSRVVVDKAIVVNSINGPAATIIQGAGPVGPTAVRGVYVGSGAVLTGFTVTGGATFDLGQENPSLNSSGGGVWCAEEGVVRECVITANTAAQSGSGAYGGTFTDCTISNNTGSPGIFGGGAMASVLKRCQISGNSAVAGGGAANSTLENCLVRNNSASDFAGGTLQSELTNCTVTGNQAGNSKGGSHIDRIHNSIVYGNTAPVSPNYDPAGGGRFAYSCTTPLPVGAQDLGGNISSNPLFAGANDFHLAANSPAKNAGSNALALGLEDLDRAFRIDDFTVDMGAYEIQLPPSEDPNLLDLSISSGALEPGFARQVTHYTSEVPSATHQITVTAVAQQPGATIRIDGTVVDSGVASHPIPLAVGQNTVTVVVTAPDGVRTKTHTIVVTRTAPIMIVEQTAGQPLRSGTLVSWGATNPPGGLTGLKTIAAGGSFGLALKDGRPIGWGGAYGNVPAGMTDIVSISAGTAHTLALKSDGSVVSWGDTGYGKSSPPGFLHGNTAAVAAGGNHSLALKNDGTVYAWGASFSGQTTVPALLNGVTVTAIAAGQDHSVVLKSTGGVVVWGTSAAVPFNAQSGVAAICAGTAHTLALRSDGTIAAWGSAQYTVFPPAHLNNNFVAISSGFDHSLGLKADGTVVAWGENSAQQCFVPANLTGVTAIAAGAGFSLALKSDTVDFGTQPTIGTGATRTFTLRNDGLEPLIFGALEISGLNASSFLVTTPPAPLVAPGASTTFTVTFQPGSAGTRQAKLSIPNNDPNAAGFTVFLTGTGVSLTPLEAWRQTHFGSPANSGNGANLFDFDRDGLCNLVEYAFGLNPTQTYHPASPLENFPRPQLVGGNFGYTFPTPVGVSGITYGAEWSATLQANDWHSIPDAGTGGQHSFMVPTGTNAKLFLRLVITTP